MDIPSSTDMDPFISVTAPVFESSIFVAFSVPICKIPAFDLSIIPPDIIVPPTVKLLFTRVL